MNVSMVHSEGIVPTLSGLLKLEHLVASTGFSLLPKQPVHSVLAGKHASKLRGRGLDFEEVRKYVAGDDIRNIDWRVTARTRQTYTKVFTEEKEKPTLAVVDMSPGMFFGSRVYTKSFVASQLAAIAGFRVLKNGDRFGGLIFNESDCQVIAPQRSRKAVLQYLKQLVIAAESLAQDPRDMRDKSVILEKALRRTLSMATHDYLILIISDFHDMNPAATRHLVQLARHNDVILSRVTDPMEGKLPGDKLVLSDGELQLLWESSKRSNGRKFEQYREDKLTGFEKEMEKHGIPILSLDTVEPVEKQLKVLFGSKLKKGRA
jgi:uncharacterized protein (DUF58 family)